MANYDDDLEDALEELEEEELATTKEERDQLETKLAEVELELDDALDELEARKGASARSGPQRSGQLGGVLQVPAPEERIEAGSAGPGDSGCLCRLSKSAPTGAGFGITPGPRAWRIR